MPHKAITTGPVRIRHTALRTRPVVATAVAELERGLTHMMGGAVAVEEDAHIDGREIILTLGNALPARENHPDALSGDSFAIARSSDQSLSIRSASERGLIHGAANLLVQLGASFPAGAPAVYPRVELERFRNLKPYTFSPSFSRRAFASDLMTWNYAFTDRLELHLHHDREFIPWMARRGLNAFSYIRHAHDTRQRIEELVPTLSTHGIAAEYGGHVLQLLLPRERFDGDPSMFPADDSGTRLPRGNLCVSNRAAIDVVCEAGLRYVADYPENELLHIWGADVRRGAWCRCGACRERAPQQQYLEVVNAIAASFAKANLSCPVAYLAYHDTIDPYPGLHPLPNVRVEWAPRERCYSHAIDDPACDVNPRYFDSLKRHLQIFEGRCDVFEYYADAILFGGLAFATPAVIARDLRVYHGLGISSVSCLTFGAYSLLAYPVNLETFVRCASEVGSDPALALETSARGRHPACATALRDAYRAIASASALVLDYADVMRPPLEPARAPRKRTELARAAECFRRAIDAADAILRSNDEPLARSERQLWRYSAQVLESIVDYLGAKGSSARDRVQRGDAAIKKIADAMEQIRAIDPQLKGTWGAYDLEWIRELWLTTLRRGLEDNSQQFEETI
jgi:Domain of unknown function (DUF4838)